MDAFRDYSAQAACRYEGRSRGVLWLLDREAGALHTPFGSPSWVPSHRTGLLFDYAAFSPADGSLFVLFYDTFSDSEKQASNRPEYPFAVHKLRPPNFVPTTVPSTEMLYQGGWLHSEIDVSVNGNYLFVETVGELGDTYRGHVVDLEEETLTQVDYPQPHLYRNPDGSFDWILFDARFTPDNHLVFFPAEREHRSLLANVVLSYDKLLKVSDDELAELNNVPLSPPLIGACEE